jgi:hypothetical protein
LRWGLPNFFALTGLSSILLISWVAGMTGMHHQVHLLVEMGSHKLFTWLSSIVPAILLISNS